MNNPSAFPQPLHPASTEYLPELGGGMTLLDYFAGQALTALDITPYSSMKHIADYAYRLAEAMLEERQKCLAKPGPSTSE